MNSAPKTSPASPSPTDLDTRAAALFALIDDHTPEAFLAAVDDLVAAAPDSADALFHRACAQDSLGHSDRAVPFYEAALELGGLTGENRRRATIQLASSLRNVGDVERALALLEAERRRPSDPADAHLDDALDCVLALTLAAAGRDREGLSLVVVALAKHLPRYSRSMANYARLLVEERVAE